MGKQHRRAQQSKVIGRVKRNPDGFGFLIPDNPELVDVYLPRHTMFGVMTDDKVEAVCREERDGRYSGEVTSVLVRATTQVVGQFHSKGFSGSGLIRDESKAWGSDIHIAPENTKKAREGELVVIKILTFPDKNTSFTGEVIEVLGVHGDPLLDTKQVLYENRVPVDFSGEALKITNSLPDEVSPHDFQGRKDLRDKKFVTIDGATARDFDDAVYAEVEPGGFRVWVAIADVSHYVKEGTALDRDAYQRGTSVYFPDMVVPMLPEKLSNGLCSLNPHVPRLAMVAEMSLDHQGQVNSTEIYEAVFTSHHRLIYGEVQEMLDGYENPKYGDVLDSLKLMRDIATLLMKKRFREGSLDLEIPEAQLIIDASGMPTDIVRGERIFAHRLIEELMLLANVAVAKFIAQSGRPSLYRIHESPFPDALKSLELMAHNWGLHIRFGSGMIQKSLMKMLDHVRDKPEEHILNILTLRSMKQAQYSVENKGHFGLAFDCYTHFTSPIRRYPDLVVHRVLKKIISKRGYIEKNRDDEHDHMATMGVFLSACEQRANQAERDLMAIKRCRFVQRHVGDVLDGMVTGVQKFGIFVQLRAYDIDGLVKIETLRNDRYSWDEQNQRLIGKRTRTVISLGDLVQVKVLRADPEARQIDFEWMEREHAPDLDRKTDRTDLQERGETPPDRRGFRKARFSQRPGAGKAGTVHPQKNHKKSRNRKNKRR